MFYRHLVKNLVSVKRVGVALAFLFVLIATILPTTGKTDTFPELYSLLGNRFSKVLSLMRDFQNPAIANEERAKLSKEILNLAAEPKRSSRFLKEMESAGAKLAPNEAEAVKRYSERYAYYVNQVLR